PAGRRHVLIIAWVSFRIASNHPSGTGGLDHPAGSLRELECDGITRVPSSPMPLEGKHDRLLSACHPADGAGRRMHQQGLPLADPEPLRSFEIDEMVAGSGVRSINSSSLIGAVLSESVRKDLADLRLKMTD
ncbi:MAG: hypothetical protein M3526_03620, partial [Actinomycetota bacterium]|nr:hypothetical protein [Actinomycetota bacterium]